MEFVHILGVSQDNGSGDAKRLGIRANVSKRPDTCPQFHPVVRGPVIAFFEDDLWFSIETFWKLGNTPKSALVPRVPVS